MLDDRHLCTSRALADLRAALDAVGNALTGVALDDLLAAEARMARAVEAVRTAPTVGQGDTGLDLASLRGDVHAVRAAMQRCRRLGVSLSQFASFSTGAASYTRRGLSRTGMVSERAVDTRV